MSKEKKIIEVVKKLDLDGNSWKIERYDDSMYLYFDDNKKAIVTFATNKFNIFCDLVDVITESKTAEIKSFVSNDMLIADNKKILLEKPRIDLIFYN